MSVKLLSYLGILFAFLSIGNTKSFSQCQLLDGNGVPSSNPTYIGCSQIIASDTDFVIVVTPANNYGNWNMIWGDGQTSSGTSLNPPAFITHTYVSVTGGGTVYADTFMFTFTSGACTISGLIISGYPVTANIEVPGGLTQLACAPGILSFINNSNGASGLPVMPSTIFTWDWGDGSPLQTFGFAQAGDTIDHTYQKNTVNCVTQVDLTANNECNLSPSVNSQSPVLIYDIDDAAIAASATILCYPDTVVNFANGSNFNCFAQGNTDQRYEYWNFGNYWGTGSDSIVNWRPSGPPLGTPAPNPIPIGFPGIGTYVVNMIDSNMCGQDPASIIINIVAPPEANFGMSDDTICAGETVTFIDSSKGGPNVYAWDFGEGAGFQSIGAGNQTHTYNTPGTYTIRFAVGIGGSTCRDTFTLILEVLVSPFPNIGLDFSVGCDSLLVNFSDSSTGTIVSWDWDFGNGQTSTNQNPGSQFYGTPGNYTVSLTIANNLGCSRTDSQVVSVFETPAPNFTPQNICVAQLAQFNDLSTSAPGDPIISWIWDFGDGSPASTLQNPTHIYAIAGNYDVILSVSTANCQAIDTFQVVVEQLPTAGFTMDTDSGCAPLFVNYTNTSSVNSDHYFWDFGDGDTSTSINPSHTFLNNFGVDTVYTITLIAYTTFGCTDTIRQTVTVFPIPIAQFNDSSLVIKCSPAVIGFINQSIGGASSYFWDFGNGNTSTSTNAIDTFYNTSNDLDTFTVTLVAFTVNGCSDTTSRDYIVFPKPASLPAVIDSGCTNLEVIFPPIVGAVNYVWDFGDLTAGTGPTPTHTYNNNDSVTKIFTVTLYSSSAAGCKDTSQGIVKVYHRPIAQIIANTSIGCQPLDVNFTNVSLYADVFHWNFDDGTSFDTTATTTSHTFYNILDTSRVYNVKMTAETQFGCTAVDSVPIRVHPSVIADFIGDTLGCSPFGASFTSLSSPAATFWAWDFGDGGAGSTTENPIHGYVTLVADTFVVRLIASSVDGCSDTAYSQVAVFPSPTANFSINPPSNTLTYPDTTFGIQNLDLDWDYIWDFGDGDSSTLAIPGSKAYTGWGSFVITLIAYNEYCSDTMQITVTILPPLPIADFGELTKGCEDLTVDFVNKSKYANSYQWRFIHTTTNSAQSSVDEHPIITFTDPGTYNVILVATGDGGVDEKIALGFIEVFEQPEAAFTVAPLEVFIPNEKIVCFNNSQGEDLTFAWDFGDGSVSNQINPEHFYTAEGEYTIALVASNSFCSDTALADSPVFAKPSGGLEAPNAFTPRIGDEPGSDGGLDYTSPGYDASSNDIFYPKVVGEIKDYEFMIFNKWGEMLFRTEIETVGWTGWYRHRACQMDVYVYKVKATLVDNSEVVLVGDVTLLR